MDDQTLNELQKEIFDQPKPSMNLEYLLNEKRKVQELDDETNAQLKKNIYQNYSLFIDSSKEIQSLKMEMYQLNNLLKQQQAYMSQLLEISITGDNGTHSLTTNDKFEAADQANLRQDESAIIQKEFDEISDDFDILIAQRDFKAAVNLVLKKKDQYLSDQRCLEPSILSDLKLKIDNKIQELIDAISSELQPSTDRTIQGGPRSASSAIRLLLKLKKSSLATKLFLNHRSNLLKFVIKQQKVDSSATSQYIKRISSIFVNNVIDTCKEFRQAFELDDIVSDYLEDTTTSNALPNNSSPYPDIDCYRQNSFNNLASNDGTNSTGSSFSPVHSNGNDLLFDHRRPTFACMVSWTKHEFEYFLTIFKGHVFGSQSSLSVIAECVYSLRSQCPELMNASGVDLTFYFDRYLHNDIERVTRECRDRLVDTIKNQAPDERWESQKFANKALLTRFLDEMNDVGIKTTDFKLSEDFKLSLTVGVTSFARLFLTTAKDLAKLSNPTCESLFSDIITEAFRIELEYIEADFRRTKLLSKVKSIIANSKFLLYKVLPLAESNYRKITKQECAKLLELKKRFHFLTEVSVSSH